MKLSKVLREMENTAPTLKELTVLLGWLDTQVWVNSKGDLCATVTW